MKVVLFIGGPADGRREAVQSLIPVKRFRELPPLPVLRPWDEVPTTIPVKDHMYTIHHVADGEYVYMHESLRPEMLPHVLLAGYNPSKPV